MLSAPHRKCTSRKRSQIVGWTYPVDAACPPRPCGARHRSTHSRQAQLQLPSLQRLGGSADKFGDLDLVEKKSDRLEVESVLNQGRCLKGHLSFLFASLDCTVSEICIYTSCNVFLFSTHARNPLMKLLQRKETSSSPSLSPAGRPSAEAQMMVRYLFSVFFPMVCFWLLSLNSLASISPQRQQFIRRRTSAFLLHFDFMSLVVTSSRGTSPSLKIKVGLPFASSQWPLKLKRIKWSES